MTAPESGRTALRGEAPPPCSWRSAVDGARQRAAGLRLHPSLPRVLSHARRSDAPRYFIFCSTGIRYFLNVTGFSDIGKCPISSMMMHSELRTFFAVFCVISGVQAKS